MLALVTPMGSGWWWRQHAGGREPSQRERLAYEDAIEHLQAHSPEPLHLPGSWFVVDEQQPDAGVCGDALMLSRGLLEVDLSAVLPHELGHLGSFDGRLTAALNRLVIHQAPRPPKDPAEAEEVRSGEGPAVVEGLLGLFDVSPKTIEIITGVFIFTWFARKFIAFARGGMALWITGPLWGLYWRGREYAADAYAAELGQAEEVADFLETHALIYDRPMPFVWLTEHSHPPTELRIDRLRNHTPEPAVELARPATA
jgi:Zn-dependent protease with chaperone function